MRERTPADDLVMTAFNRAILDLIVPSMRSALDQLGSVLSISDEIIPDLAFTIVGSSDISTIVTIIKDSIMTSGVWVVFSDKSKTDLNKLSSDIHGIIYCGRGSVQLKLHCKHS